MRIFNCQDPCSVRTSGLLILLFASVLSSSTPVPADSDSTELSNRTIAERGCDGTLCGWYNQLCCRWNEGCHTNYQTQAVCTPNPTARPRPQAGGHWVYYTTTWVERERVTHTRIIRSYVPPRTIYHPPQTTQKEARCYNGDHPCGPICCRSWQSCIVGGQCGRYHGPAPVPPARPTSYVSRIHTLTLTPTTTTGTFIPAITTHHRGGGGGVTISESSGGGGLSAGAIAGIVIGVIIGIILLIFLCMILCFKTAWDAFIAFFGFGSRRKRRETVEYEHYSRHGSRSGDRKWYGSGRPPNGSPPRREEKKKSGGFPGWATVVAGLVALWAALGFRRRRNRERRDEKSSYTSSGYYSDYTSSSSDRRTRDTRRSSRR